MKSVHRPNEFGQDHQALTDEPPPARTAPSRDPQQTGNGAANHPLDALRARLILLLGRSRNGHPTTLSPPPEPFPPCGQPVHDPLSTIHHSVPAPNTPPLRDCIPSESLTPQLSTLNPLANQVDWPLLLKQTARFARKRIGRFSWRAEEGGVLPGGWDANSIAAEAVAQMLRDRQENFSPISPQEVRAELRRLVHRHIDCLRHRKENRLVRNEQDLAPVLAEDGELISIWETIPAPEANPLEALIKKEEAAELDSMKDQFISFLGQDPLLKEVFACLCAGISQRAALALKLKVAPQSVKNAQERLARRIAEFQHRKKS